MPINWFTNNNKTKDKKKLTKSKDDSAKTDGIAFRYCCLKRIHKREIKKKIRILARAFWLHYISMKTISLMRIYKRESTQLDLIKTVVLIRPEAVININCCET